MALGRNAVSIYQDLVDVHGFAHRYNSVKRFGSPEKSRRELKFRAKTKLPGLISNMVFSIVTERALPGKGGPARRELVCVDAG